MKLNLDSPVGAMGCGCLGGSIILLLVLMDSIRYGCREMDRTVSASHFLDTLGIREPFLLDWVRIRRWIISWTHYLFNTHTRRLNQFMSLTLDQTQSYPTQFLRPML